MNKKMLKNFVFNNKTITLQFIIDQLATITDLSGQSKVNPNMPKEIVVNGIFKKYIDLRIERGLGLNDPIETTGMNKAYKVVLNNDGRFILNVLIETKFKG